MANEKIEQCLEALERLIEGKPINIEPDSYDEITYGLIEREAGTVSKGYIKHKRKPFEGIVKKLNDHKAEIRKISVSAPKNSLQTQIDDLLSAREKDKQRIIELEQKLHIMMSDNLKLVAQSRKLEKENLDLGGGRKGQPMLDRKH